MRAWVVTVAVLALSAGTASAQQLTADLYRYTRFQPPQGATVGLEAKGSYTMAAGQTFLDIQVMLYKWNNGTGKWEEQLGQWQYAVTTPTPNSNPMAGTWIYNFPSNYLAGDYKVVAKLRRPPGVFQNTPVVVKEADDTETIP